MCFLGKESEPYSLGEESDQHAGLISVPRYHDVVVHRVVPIDSRGGATELAYPDVGLGVVSCQ
jgi:hypothetical protein